MRTPPDGQEIAPERARRLARCIAGKGHESMFAVPAVATPSPVNDSVGQARRYGGTSSTPCPT